MLAVLLVPALGHTFNVAGRYDSSEGKMTLQQSGDRVQGRYGNDNGELTGILFDSTLDGFWIENSSSRRCSTPKNGRYYWGRVKLEFSGSGFSGKWGYCEEPLNSTWSGTRLSGGAGMPALPADSADALVIDGGTRLEGVWGSTEGDIRFRQQGNRLSGRYATDNGEIVGTVDNNVLRGFWIEDHSGRRCATPRNGRYFWGRVEFRFSGDSFSGRWGYCDEGLSGSWSGQRK